MLSTQGPPEEVERAFRGGGIRRLLGHENEGGGSHGPRLYEKGDKMAEDLDYIPMPDNVVKLVEATWAKDIPLK
jgi:hypothetical protein